MAEHTSTDIETTAVSPIENDSPPTSAEDFLDLSRQQASGGDIAAAIATLESGRATFPNDYAWDNALGELSLNAGNEAAAIKYFKSAADGGGSGSGEASAQLANIYFESENYDAALPYLKTANTATPGDFTVNMRIAYIQFQRERYDAALDHYRNAIDAKPESIDARVGLAKSYEKTGNEKAAIRSYKKVLKEKGLSPRMEPLVLATSQPSEQARQVR